MSMPDGLFYPVGTVPCIMVFTAHTPHNSNIHHKTWFGYWKDDGFVKSKNFGRIDARNTWKKIEDIWLDSFFNRKEIPGLSVLKKVSSADEWCAEAYMETDYSDTSEDDFMDEMKKYVIFRTMNLEE